MLATIIEVAKSGSINAALWHEAWAVILPAQHNCSMQKLGGGGF